MSIYQGKTITAKHLSNGIVELSIDVQGSSANTLGQLAIDELAEATRELGRTKDINGLLVTSGKSDFILGADITEFTQLFGRPDDEVIQRLRVVCETFNHIEDLPFPTVVAINGYALGKGRSSMWLKVSQTT